MSEKQRIEHCSKCDKSIEAEDFAGGTELYCRAMGYPCDMIIECEENRMTIDEAIKHCIEQAEIQDKLSQSDWLNDIGKNNCRECAADHKQLAEWLTELKELKAADVQPVNRWISVKDRLPEECETVLIYAPRTQNRYYIAMFYMLNDEIKFATKIYGKSYCWYADDVTHWQPLPEPPNQ